MSSSGQKNGTTESNVAPDADSANTTAKVLAVATSWITILLFLYGPPPANLHTLWDYASGRQATRAAEQRQAAASAQQYRNLENIRRRMFGTLCSVAASKTPTQPANPTGISAWQLTVAIYRDQARRNWTTNAVIEQMFVTADRANAIQARDAFNAATGYLRAAAFDQSSNNWAAYYTDVGHYEDAEGTFDTDLVRDDLGACAFPAPL